MPIRIESHPDWHFVFEALGYVLAYLIYRRNPESGDRWWGVIAGAAVGALVGSRLLEVLEQAPRTGINLAQLVMPSGGKTVVGGLLGGWLGVEIAKKLSGIRSRTGDLFAVPLCGGIAVGRTGCLFGGLSDDTYGKPTTQPWGVDFGDGVPRHPTQAYEILFLAGLGSLLVYLQQRPHQQGVLFRYFMAAYLSWRLLIDFLKPEPLMAGMNAIQWACVAGLLALVLTRGGVR